MRFVVSGTAAWLSVVLVPMVRSGDDIAADPPMDDLAWLEDMSWLSSFISRSSLEEGADLLPQIRKSIFTASEMSPQHSDAERARQLRSDLRNLRYADEKIWREYLYTPQGVEDVTSRIERLGRMWPRPDKTINLYVNELQALLPPKLAGIVYGEYGPRTEEAVPAALSGLNEKECMTIAKFADFKLSPVGNLKRGMTGAERALKWASAPRFHDRFVDELIAKMARQEIAQLIPEDSLRLVCKYHLFGDLSRDENIYVDWTKLGANLLRGMSPSEASVQRAVALAPAADAL